MLELSHNNLLRLVTCAESRPCTQPTTMPKAQVLMSDYVVTIVLTGTFVSCASSLQVTYASIGHPSSDVSQADYPQQRMATVVAN